MFKETVRQIRPKDLAERLRDGLPVVLVDVREPWEHEETALPGSVLMPLPELPARAVEYEPPPEDLLVVVYCHHGIRSLPGAAYLRERWGPNVVSLAGGIDAWSLEVDPSVPRY